jgi:hypothetical protein
MEYRTSSDFSTFLDELRSLVKKMERLSADSYFAHQVSGYRGNLLRSLERFEGHPELISSEEILFTRMLMDRSYAILIAAAREIGKR